MVAVAVGQGGSRLLGKLEAVLGDDPRAPDAKLGLAHLLHDDRGVGERLG
jgi:hypothetical protein